jgi:hypothetical protein
MTSTKWFGTAAVALVIGTGAVIAQTSPDGPQKREDSPRAQVPMKDTERPSAGEQRQKDRTAQQPDSKAVPKDMKETQRSEDKDKSAPQRQQAQEPSQARDSKQPTKQTQDQPGKRSPADAAQQRQDEQKGKGREARQPADQKQQQSRDQQQKQDNQAVDSKQPAEAKQQTSQQPESKQPSRDQASQPADARKGDTAQQPGSATTATSTVNDQQRTEVRQRLSRERTAMSRETQNLNIQVNVGTQLPPRVRPRPLPPDIVRIVPRYRGYEYTVIDDEIVVLEPRTRRVVEIISEPERGSRMSASPAGQRIVIAPEHREILKQTVRRSSTTGSTGQPGAAFDANCLTLQAVPEELTRANPDLGNYKMLAIGEQVVLIDPQEQKVVEVID